jgi:nicotinamidase/pyrazinamidase
MKLEFAEETNKIVIVFEKTASLNVDPQKGFMPLCPDELPVLDGENIVTELNAQNKIVKYTLLSKDIHPNNAAWIATPLSPVGLPDVDVHWNRHCQSGTKGAELLDGLQKITDYDFFVVVAKGFEPNIHPYSACYHNLDKTISTGIIEWLNQHDVSTVIVGGLALNVEDTPLCVGHTVIDLCNAGFQVILNMGAVRSLGTKEGETKFLNMLVNDYNVLIVNSYKNITIEL